MKIIRSGVQIEAGLLGGATISHNIEIMVEDEDDAEAQGELAGKILNLYLRGFSNASKKWQNAD